MADRYSISVPQEESQKPHAARDTGLGIPADPPPPFIGGISAPRAVSRNSAPSTVEPVELFCLRRSSNARPDPRRPEANCPQAGSTWLALAAVFVLLCKFGLALCVSPRIKGQIWQQKAPLDSHTAPHEQASSNSDSSLAPCLSLSIPSPPSRFLPVIRHPRTSQCPLLEFPSPPPFLLLPPIINNPESDIRKHHQHHQPPLNLTQTSPAIHPFESRSPPLPIAAICASGRWRSAQPGHPAQVIPFPPFDRLAAVVKGALSTIHPTSSETCIAEIRPATRSPDISHSTLDSPHSMMLLPSAPFCDRASHHNHYHPNQHQQQHRQQQQQQQQQQQPSRRRSTRTTMTAQALFSSPPASDEETLPFMSTAHIGLGIYTSCKALQSMLTTSQPAPVQPPPPPRYNLRSPISITGVNKRSTRRKTLRPDRGHDQLLEREGREAREREMEQERQRQRDREAQQQEQEDQDVYNLRYSTPKRFRIVPRALPLGLSPADFDALEEHAEEGGEGLLQRSTPLLLPSPLPTPTIATSTTPAILPPRSPGGWTRAQDAALVQLVLERLRLDQDDWDECARALGRESGSVGRRWKELMGEGSVGMRWGRGGRRPVEGEGGPEGARASEEERLPSTCRW
ncbi:MAG: hypothetical protein M1829_005058 [Trizodia sp. TS-e1964]|nr:MAG: hypothetical protein M1829_005058 [Trizodia sp. TS-e1964]